MMNSRWKRMKLRMRIWICTSVSAFSSCLSSASLPSWLAWCPGIAANKNQTGCICIIKYFSWHILVSPRQSNQKTNTIMFLGQTLNRWKTEIFTKIEGSELHIYTQWNSKFPNVAERPAAHLPAHQAFYRPWGGPTARAPGRSRICINSESCIFYQMKINDLIPPGAGFFLRVHEGDLVEEIVEVEPNVNLWLLLLFFFFLLLLLFLTTVITITTIINRLNRLGSRFILPDKRGKIKQGSCWLERR